MNKRMETTKKKLGEATFYIKPFAAFTAANISGELASVLSPLLGGMAPMMKDTNVGDAAGDKAQTQIMDMDMEEILPSIAGALSGMDGDKIEHLMFRLLVQYKNISVASPETDDLPEPLSMDLANEIFCGDLLNMLRLCAEVVKINFGGFFESTAALFGSLLSDTKSEKTAKDGTKSTES